MVEQPVLLTKAGLKRLEDELRELRTVRRAEVAASIREAQELGMAQVDGQYEEAKNQQAFIEGRIREIKNTLARAEMIDEENGNTHEVRVGSSVTVKLEDEEEEETWTIVGSTEANPRSGKISNESPIGAALLGKKPRQKVTVNTPAGTMKLTILKIR